MGITYDHLIDKGITPQIMAAFNMPLSLWVELGFSEQHTVLFSDAESMMVFALSKAELRNIVTMMIILSFAPPKTRRHT